MANSNGIDYFPFNVDFFDDDKIALIEGEFQLKGSYIAMRLLCKIYKEGYYYQWGEDECLLFARKMGNGIVPNTVKEVVNGLIRRSFFDKGVYDSFSILTSRGIQTRYFEAAKRRQKIEVKREYLLVNVDKYPNVYIQSENVYIQSENADISKQKKRKESKVIPPLTPPCGVVPEERGGSLSLDSKKINLKELIAGKSGVSDYDYWETMRLTNEGNEKSIGTAIVKQWAENPSMCPYYQVIQHLQGLYEKGQIQAISHENYFVYVFLRMNLMKSDQETIKTYIQNPTLFEECKKLIAECKKGGINQPGKFIIAGLRKTLCITNKQAIK